MSTPNKEIQLSIGEPNFSVRPPLDTETTETTAHPAVAWAEAVLAYSPLAGRLRESVVNMYPDLPDHFGTLSTKPGLRYAKLHQWATFEPKLTEIALSLSNTAQPSPEQQEVIGFAAIVNSKVANNALQEGQLYQSGISVHPLEFEARVTLAEDYQDPDDWLTALSHVVWIRGRQREADTKAGTISLNAACISALGHSVGVEDIERIYEGTARLIRPNAQAVEPFRENDNNFDQVLRTHYIVYNQGNEDIAPYLNSFCADHRKSTVGIFLRQYNYDLRYTPQKTEGALAWFYATYLAMHPHPDYNGTIARSLINGYLQVQGLPSINWLAIKQNRQTRNDLQRRWEEYVFRADQTSLEEWFHDHING